LILPARPERNLNSQNDVRIAILAILAAITVAVASCGKASPGDKVNSGLNAGKLLTFEISLPEQKYLDANQRVAFFQQALQRITAISGVESVGAASTHPLSDDRQSVRFTIEPTQGEAIDSIPAGFNVVSPGYFQTLMAPLLAGRTLTETDTGDAVRVVVINETLARRFFLNEDPIGRRVQFDDLEEQGSWVTIVGVAGDIKQSDSNDPQPEFYMSYLQAPLLVMTIIVRTAGDARELSDTVVREVKAVEGEVTISNIETMK
jgi:putative ABC transport system permease protein